MGIEIAVSKVLNKSYKSRGSLGRTATLGRQTLYLKKEQLGKFINNIDYLQDSERYRYTGAADNFLKDAFGSTEVISFDNSDYEGASVVHDFNNEIDESHYSSFDTIIDGGTLEHIFNFPVAIKNCMRMLKPGGRLFIFSISNNHMGHGFYQFSPELFFRLFSEKYGFKIHQIYLFTHDYPGAEISHKIEYYEINDPEVVGERVGLVNNKPTCLTIESEKVSEVELFKINPQQSDYIPKWQNESRNEIQKTSIKQDIKDLLEKVSPFIMNRIRGIKQLRSYSTKNKKHFRKLTDSEI